MPQALTPTTVLLANTSRQHPDSSMISNVQQLDAITAMEPGATHTEPVFRANKRQKVFRKRDDRVADDNLAAIETISAQQTQADDAKIASVGDNGTVHTALYGQKRPGVKKHGIAFSSKQQQRSESQESEQDKSLVLVPSLDAGDVANDRFVRQTGRVGLTEDKHMLNFIDKKMAEIRSTALSSTTSHSQQPSSAISQLDDVSEADSEEDATNETATPMDHHGTQDKSTSKGFNIARTTIPGRGQIAKRRGRKKQPDPSDIARDSLVDQIMQESQTDVPLYDRAPAPNRFVPKEGKDNDEAAAEAFKAQLLVDLQQSRRRRAPPSASKAGEKTSYGPKLGGSRSQREKMRALEEAKTSGGVTKK